MQTSIKIKLHFRCILGLLPFERQIAQRVSLDIKASSKGFLDYAKVAKRAKKLYKKGRFHTIEKSLEIVAKELKLSFPKIKYIKISLIKKDIIKNAKVGASMMKKY